MSGHPGRKYANGCQQRCNDDEQRAKETRDGTDVFGGQNLMRGRRAICGCAFHHDFVAATVKGTICVTAVVFTRRGAVMFSWQNEYAIYERNMG